MPPLPKTITLRKRLAQQMRRRLYDYQQDCNNITDHGRAMNTIADAVALAKLEGISDVDITIAVGRGSTGRINPNPA